MKTKIYYLISLVLIALLSFYLNTNAQSPAMEWQGKNNPLAGRSGEYIANPMQLNYPDKDILPVHNKNNIQSQNILACTSRGDIIIINPTNCFDTLLCHNSTFFTDLAYESGVLYGNKGDSLYTINTTTGVATGIAYKVPMGFLNALVGDGSGHLYAAGWWDTFISKYDVATCIFSQVGSVGYPSLGDLAFKDGWLYMIGCRNIDTSTILIKINLSPFSSSVVGTLNFGLNTNKLIHKAWGLATVSSSGETNLYASVTDYKNHLNYLYKIDETNATTTLICSDSMMGIVNGSYIYGLASAPNGIVGISEINRNNNISIYPNPGNGIINIETKDIDAGKEDLKVEVTNLSGQVIYSNDFNNNTMKQIDLSNQPKGIYFLKLMSEDVVRVEKVVIQ